MLRNTAIAVVCGIFLSIPQVTWSQINAYDTVVNNGDSSNRVDMIFIGDGYQSHEINTTYVSHINQTLDHFFSNSLSSPFDRYSGFFNVHRVNVVSNQSGADQPNDNIFVDTALDASFSWGGGPERCLYFNTSKANTAVANALAGSGIDNDGLLLGSVNTTKYGGCGGQWGVYSAGNSSANEVALHEIGHSYANLADEYFYSDDHYSGSEFSEWNVTNDPSSGKWDRWVGYDDPNSNIGAIGYYEGGRYHQTGVWRPSDNSKMRSLGRAFDAVSREKFIYEIYQEVDPLDQWIELEDGAIASELWVQTVDSDVINVEWFVDGESVGLHGENLDLAALGLASGEYDITARAYDAILDHSNTGDGLDWWRLGSDDLEQSVSWTVTVVAVPEPSTGLLCGAILMGFCSFYRRRG